MRFEIEKKRILITGASGFIGGNLIDTLKSVFEDVTIAVISRSQLPSDLGVHHYSGDITERDFVRKVVMDFKPNVVYHLAAHKERSRNINSIADSLNVNLMGTLNLYQALLDLDELELVVTIGTSDEYGACLSPYQETDIENPMSFYGFSKLCATKLSQFFHRVYEFPVVVLRPTIAYGPHQGMDMFIPSLIHSLIKEKSYNMTPGNQLRDFIYISDLVDVMIELMKAPKIYVGELFNVGSGKVYRIKEIAELVANQLNKEPFLNIGAIAYREHETMEYRTSVEKIKERMRWKPKVELKEGIRATIKYYSDNHE